MITGIKDRSEIAEINESTENREKALITEKK